MPRKSCDHCPHGLADSAQLRGRNRRGVASQEIVQSLHAVGPFAAHSYNL
jgi:hypothetical protein